MKKLVTLSILSLLFAFFQNCQSQKNNVAELNRQWMLISFREFSKDFLMKNKASLQLQKNIPNSIYLGCNTISIRYKVERAQKITWILGATTEMFCPSNNELEKSFLADLPRMTKFQIQGHYLTLTNENGETMKFVAADWD